MLKPFRPMVRPGLFLFAFAWSICGIGQSRISGQVRSRQGNEPVGFANIGLKQAGTGTISETDGSFSLPLLTVISNDTLLVSAMGYTTRRIPLKGISDFHHISIILDGKVTTLKPVIVSTSRVRPKTLVLGNTQVRGGVYEPDTVYSGWSFALLMDTTGLQSGKKLKLPAYITQARLRIFRNNMQRCRYRVRILAADPLTGIPGQDLLHESIVVESSARKGWIDFDLTGSDLVLNAPFFVCFEQLLDRSDRVAISDGYRDFMAKYPDRIEVDTVMVNGLPEVSSRLGRGGIDLPGTFIAMSGTPSVRARFRAYTRQSSFAPWEKSNGIPTATVTLSEAPGLLAATEVCIATPQACAAENYLRELMEETGIPGLQVMAVQQGRLLIKNSFGFANLSAASMVSDSTPFRINSISKTITALAIARLVEQGRVNIDTPVSAYISGLRFSGYSPTIRQCLGHLAGFRDYDEKDLRDFFRDKHYNNATEALEVFSSDTLLSVPGSRFHYSPFGFNLVGAVIEKITGKTFTDYVQQEILRPLQMAATFPDGMNVSGTDGSRYYDADGSEGKTGDLSYKYPAAGFVSTCDDLIRLGLAMGDGFIPDRYRDLLVTEQHTDSGIPTGYGMGWYTGKDASGRRIWYHYGDSFTGSSGLLVYPDEQLVLAFLANSQAGVVVDLTHIASLFLDKRTED
ncbi:MAG: hypothetical protein EOO09_14510 [Chitinophagaceae bacterium]|nr:MAG: hypothetical protein EOO09_14510 [Chitinophagaceae bacterium]